MLRLSCTDASFPFLSPGIALQVVRDLGFEHVDLCTFAQGSPLPLSDVLDDPVGAAAAASRRLEAAGLEVSDVFAILAPDFSSLALNHPESAVRRTVRQRLSRVLAFAEAVRAPGLTVLPGTRWDGEEAVASVDRAGAMLRRLVSEAADNGMALSIEPHVGSLIETTEATRDLLERVPGLSLTLDHSHFIFRGETQEEIGTLLDRTRHVQLRQAAVGRLQTLLEEGTIDLSRLAADLEARGYEGYVCLEYSWSEWLDCHRIDCIAETVKLRRALQVIERTGALGI